MFDRYCISCHGLDKVEKDVNLLGALSAQDRHGVRQFSAAYDALLASGRVKVAPRNGETYPSRPKDYFAHAGTLAQMLLDGHPDNEGKKRVELDRESFQRIVDWLDLNAQWPDRHGGILDQERPRLARAAQAGRGLNHPANVPRHGRHLRARPAMYVRLLLGQKGPRRTAEDQWERCQIAPTTEHRKQVGAVSKQRPSRTSRAHRRAARDHCDQGENAVQGFAGTAHGITAVDPATGKVRWEGGHFGRDRCVASPVLGPDLVIVGHGFGVRGTRYAAFRAGPRQDDDSWTPVYEVTKDLDNHGEVWYCTKMNEDVRPVSCLMGRPHRRPAAPSSSKKLPQAAERPRRNNLVNFVGRTSQSVAENGRVGKPILPSNCTGHFCADAEGVAAFP